MAALLTLVLVIVVNLALGLLPRVDNFAHIGGRSSSGTGSGEAQAQDVPVRAVAGRRRAAVQRVQCERALPVVPLPQLRADQEVEVRRVADHVHGDAVGEHAHRCLRQR